jgi:hypothetical protein
MTNGCWTWVDREYFFLLHKMSKIDYNRHGTGKHPEMKKNHFVKKKVEDLVGRVLANKTEY